MKMLSKSIKEDSYSPAQKEESSYEKSLKEMVQLAWALIPPVWSLENAIACNPLHGLESLSFEEACSLGAHYFERSEFPKPLLEINRQTIKWCQAYFDKGQAAFSMPDRGKGLYQSLLDLWIYDVNLHDNLPEKINLIQKLTGNPLTDITHCLIDLKIPFEWYQEVLTLLLTSLPGWAGYVKCEAEWCLEGSISDKKVTLEEYLAIRVVMSMLLWPTLNNDIKKENKKIDSIDCSHKIKKIKFSEERYSADILPLLRSQASKIDSNQNQSNIDAQFVFCIDVRSEPFRRALEAEGNYETFGFAGFFGIPVKIKKVCSEEFNSCPVLLKPAHVINDQVHSCEKDIKRHFRGRSIIKSMRGFYQSLKYSFSTHFGLVEILGPWSGLWMMAKTLWPRRAISLKRSIVKFIRPEIVISPAIEKNSPAHGEASGIDFVDQCQYAANSLLMMGLTQNFAPIVVFCGHGSTTENNPFATALDCGACGGHQGGKNAQILAAILNSRAVREWLENKKAIIIPPQTTFVGAQHDTTTDEVKFFSLNQNEIESNHKWKKIQNDLAKARLKNNIVRGQALGYFAKSDFMLKHCQKRSHDWSQTRPEWGLAKNASFVVAPRKLTNNIVLDGRSFLHSYDWQLDPEGKYLEVILTAPMVVAQWINTQYLFSTWNNVAYGSGSKVTQNVTSKIGVMQGNGSDLMHGLPLQSVYRTDNFQYHEPMRLLTVVYAPRTIVRQIIERQPVLQKLFGNGWVNLAVIDPTDHEIYRLERDLKWVGF